MSDGHNSTKAAEDCADLERVSAQLLEIDRLKQKKHSLTDTPSKQGGTQPEQ
jgi:hypothetical protein